MLRQVNCQMMRFCDSLARLKQMVLHVLDELEMKFDETDRAEIDFVARTEIEIADRAETNFTKRTKL